MYSEEEAEILRVLLDDLREAFTIKKASRSLTAAQNAYMQAAYNYRDLKRFREREIQIIGSQENTNADA